MARSSKYHVPVAPPDETMFAPTAIMAIPLPKVWELEPANSAPSILARSIWEPARVDESYCTSTLYHVFRFNTPLSDPTCTPKLDPLNSLSVPDVVRTIEAL